MPVILFALSFTLLNCNKDKDPGPDLSSAKLTLNWNFSTPAGAQYAFYAIVSDTSGNVQNWKEITLKTPTELPYPPDPNLAVLTIVTKAPSISGGSTTVATMFTGVAAGTYTFTPDMAADLPASTGEIKISVKDAEEWDYMNAYMSGVYADFDMTTAGNVDTYNYGIYNNNTYNLLVWGKRSGSVAIGFNYYENLTDGDSLGISTTEWAAFPFMPAHDVTYPDYSKYPSTVVTITGISDESGNYELSSHTTNNTVKPYLEYPDIANLFSSYQTELESYAANGDTYYNRHTATTPNLSFTNLNATLDKKHSFTTKRVAVDLSGDGDVVYFEDIFGSASNGLFLQAYLPKSAKVRMNIPQFPSDVTTQIPGLALITERTIDYLYVDEYDVKYADLFKYWVESGFNAYVPEMKSKGFDAGGGASRTSLPDGIQKRFKDKGITVYAK